MDWRITPEWQDETVFIIAGGPSLRGVDLSGLRGRRVIVVNSSYEAVPWADLVYFGDHRWCEDHYKRPAFLAFAGRKVTCSAAVKRPGILHLKRVTPPPGFATDPDSVASQRTSLQGAMNIAAHLGVGRIVLVGADMGRAPDGASHHHSPHKWRNVPGNETWDKQMADLRGIVLPLNRLGIEVINTSLNSRCDFWPKLPLESAMILANIRRRKVVMAEGGIEDEKFSNLLVYGMHGLGDSIMQRAAVRQLLDRYDGVWLETPWPFLYHDFDSSRLHLIEKGSRLRTQAKNAELERKHYCQIPAPFDRSIARVNYPVRAIRENGDVLSAMLATMRCDKTKADFSFPVRPEWREEASRIVARWKTDKPLMIVRPLVERAEWGGNSPRNPRPEDFAALFESIRHKFFTVSIADLKAGAEWTVGPKIKTDLTFSHGEFRAAILAALYERAALAFHAPGFATVLSAAVGTPGVTVFGGYQNSRTLNLRTQSPRLYIDPVTPCSCFSHTHACNKRIDIRGAIPKLQKFADAAATKSQELPL